MDAPLLIVPGYRGSGPDHWQSWLEQQQPRSTRVTGIDWQQPVLAQWAAVVRDALAKADEPQWIVAHSFGCLASVVAAADRPEQVAQLILVAPADPARFDCMGLKPDHTNDRFTLERALPTRKLHVRGLVISSRNDPWLAFDKATLLARNWGLALHDAGNAGHINAESGHGPWPQLLKLLARRRGRTAAVERSTVERRGRGSALAAVRQLTREQMQSPQDHRLWQQG
jgi:predicted alpha/beta hydrolase family esterase